MRYDLVVVGGGPGGYAAAIRASQLGLRTALVERDAVGGTCLNRGCIPTKTLLHSAHLYREMLTCQSFGLQAEGVRFDYGAMSARKDEVTGQLRSGVEGLLKGNKVELLRGSARVEEPGKVRVGEEVLETRHILIATGAVPAKPPVPGLDLPGVVTSDELLEDLRPRERMIILGGGVIGVELACVWAAAGCRVTILEALERILANLDRELSQSLTLQLKRDGVELLTGAHVTRISPGLTVHFTHKGAEQTAQAETVLAAMGRVPATAGLFAGVEPAMERGFLQVNERFQTSIPSLYAIGDAIGGAMLAHKAEAEGCAAADLLLGRAPVRGVSPVPACVYTDPEIAQVGLTADDCKARGIPFAAGKCVMGGNGRTLIAGGKRGFLKLVFHAQTHALLGACLYCCRATDLISELTLAVTLGLTAEQLLRPVRPHPTFSEAVTEAVEAGLAALTR